MTEADGRRDAAVRVAEGQRQAVILQAEGDRQAAVLRAEGYALALEKVFAVARDLDRNTMSLQYLEALRSLGANPATKILIPMELTALLRPFVGHAEEAVAPRPAGDRHAEAPAEARH